ncbi:hypothetical protein JCM8547_008779 [Rhodosporidiobolus lusitaniae]
MQIDQQLSSPSRGEIDVAELDRLCEACLLVDASTRVEAEARLLTFRFFAVQTLERQVTFAWTALDTEEKASVRSFLLDAVNDAASSDSPLHLDRPYLLKLDAVLVKVAEVEDWADFLSKPLDSAQTSPSHCENALRVITMLADDVNEKSGRILSSPRMQALRDSLDPATNDIVRLVEAVLRPIEQVEPGCDVSLFSSAVSAFAVVVGGVKIRALEGMALLPLLLPCFRFPELQVVSFQLFASLLTATKAEAESCTRLSLLVVEALAAASPPPGSSSLTGYAAWSESCGDDLAMPLASLLTSALDGIVGARIDFKQVSPKEFTLELLYWSRFLGPIYDEENEIDIATPFMESLLDGLKTAVAWRMEIPFEYTISEGDFGESAVEEVSKTQR